MVVPRFMWRVLSMQRGHFRAPDSPFQRTGAGGAEASILPKNHLRTLADARLNGHADLRLVQLARGQGCSHVNCDGFVLIAREASSPCAGYEWIHSTPLGRGRPALSLKRSKPFLKPDLPYACAPDQHGVWAVPIPGVQRAPGGGQCVPKIEASWVHTSPPEVALSRASARHVPSASSWEPPQALPRPRMSEPDVGPRRSPGSRQGQTESGR